MVFLKSTRIKSEFDKPSCSRRVRSGVDRLLMAKKKNKNSALNSSGSSYRPATAASLTACSAATITVAADCINQRRPSLRCLAHRNDDDDSSSTTAVRSIVKRRKATVRSAAVHSGAVSFLLLYHNISRLGRLASLLAIAVDIND